jgi:hypothetical protein
MNQAEQAQYYSIMQNLWNNKNVKDLCKYFFQVDITPGEEEIVSSVAFDESPRTIICCMTRYGKSYCVSMGILLWIMSNPNNRIVIIAPTNEKTGIIRNYVYSFITQSIEFSRLVDLQKIGLERIRKEVSRRRMTFTNGAELRALSAEGQGEQLMGFGAKKVVVDEECDIGFEVYRARITRMLGDSQYSTYVGIGNPWHRDNQMFLHWTDPSWKHIHIDWKMALTEGRVTQQFIDEQKSILTDREFTVLYDANFPAESEDQLIKYSWIENAYSRPFPAGMKGIRRLGVDVARKGVDATVLTSGISSTSEELYAVNDIREFNQLETMETTGKVMERNKEVDYDKIIVDTSGLGAGVTDRLREIKREGNLRAEIIAYEGGKSSSADFQTKTKERKEIRTRFLNMKAEAYFKLRRLFEEGKIIIPKNPKLIDQLSKMKWDVTSNEKIRILDPGTAPGDTAEEKSPDFADSLCYFCWDGTRQTLAFGSLNVMSK